MLKQLHVPNWVSDTWSEEAGSDSGDGDHVGGREKVAGNTNHISDIGTHFMSKRFISQRNWEKQAKSWDTPNHVLIMQVQ